MDFAALSSLCTPEQKIFDWNETLSPDSEKDLDVNEKGWGLDMSEKVVRSCPDYDYEEEVPVPSPVHSNRRRSSVSGPRSNAKFWIDFDLKNLLCLLSFEEQKLPSMSELFVSVGKSELFVSLSILGLFDFFLTQGHVFKSSESLSPAVPASQDRQIGTFRFRLRFF